MKPILLSAALLFASVSWAQDKPAPKAPAKPQAERSAAPKAETPPPEVEKPAAVAKKSRRAEDARHCLDKGSNTEIIKCAEAYL